MNTYATPATLIVCLAITFALALPLMDEVDRRAQHTAEETKFQTQQVNVKWEYGNAFAPDGSDLGEFQIAGGKGYEAIFCRRANDGGKPLKWGYECIFKRRVEGTK